jgi:hypothetical protein
MGWGSILPSPYTNPANGGATRGSLSLVIRRARAFLPDPSSLVILRARVLPSRLFKPGHPESPCFSSRPIKPGHPERALFLPTHQTWSSREPAFSLPDSSSLVILRARAFLRGPKDLSLYDFVGEEKRFSWGRTRLSARSVAHCAPSTLSSLATQGICISQPQPGTARAPLVPRSLPTRSTRARRRAARMIVSRGPWCHASNSTKHGASDVRQMWGQSGPTLIITHVPAGAGEQLGSWTEERTNSHA